MWETVYFHEMPSHESILEWYRGTGLRPYLAQLQESDRPIFEQELLEQIKQTYPVQKMERFCSGFQDYSGLQEKNAKKKEELSCEEANGK